MRGSGHRSEECSAATFQRYPKNSSSCNKVKDDCNASSTAVAGMERCGSDAMTGAASRDLIYDYSRWTYDHVGNECASKDARTSRALASCDQVSAHTLMADGVAEIASNAATATLHLWFITQRAAAAAAKTGVHGATATGHDAVTDLPGVEATVGGNP
ncbi:hypothetical protein MRX96_002019 [Rhipicephalus microplus]